MAILHTLQHVTVPATATFEVATDLAGNTRLDIYPTAEAAEPSVSITTAGGLDDQVDALRGLAAAAATMAEEVNDQAARAGVAR